MTKKKQEWVVQKGSVRAVATPATKKGLLKHGWTLVDDGTKDVVVNVEETEVPSEPEYVEHPLPGEEK